MKAIELEVANFRSYKRAKVSLGSGLKTIVGENNVGKSSLLAALQAIRVAGGIGPEDWPFGNSDGPMSLRLELNLGEPEIKRFCKELEIPDRDSSYLGTELTIKIDWERQGAQVLPYATLGPLRIFSNGTASLESQDPMMGYMPILWNEVLRVSKGSTGSIWEAAKSKMKDYSKNSPGINIRLEFPKNAFTTIITILQERIVIFPEFRQRPLGGAPTEDVQSPEGTQIPAVLFNLKNSVKKAQRKRFDEIQRFFTGLFPTLQLEVVKGPHVLIERTGTGSEIPLARIGAGIAQMITLLTHLVGSEDMIFVLDGPELHLHPHSQRLLRKVLEGSTQNQVVVVTHSPEFINFSEPNGILLVRQVEGQSQVIQLPNDYLRDKEKAGMSKMVWSEDKDFLFSRRVLLVEGPTEYAAMPILADRLGLNLDENAVSVVEVGGDYFGLFLKLLKGFGLPFLVMCDKDALMNIGKGKIETRTKKIRTSPLFYAIWRAGLLSDDDVAQLIKVERNITTTQANGKNVVRYDERESSLLESSVNKYGFRILSPNFEGFLLRKGFRNLLRNAGRNYHKDKILQGRYVAMKMENIPKELKEIIAEVSSLK